MQELEGEEMSCKYKETCPCYSGWCERPKPDYGECVPFLITAYEQAVEELERREDKLSQIKGKIKKIRRICKERR